MALFKVSRIVRDSEGDVVPSVQVTVNQAGTSTKQTIYSDAAGTVKANPLTSGSDGRYEFWVDEGATIDLDFSKTGFTIPSEDGFTAPSLEVDRAPESRTLSTDSPLTGGGDLSEDRTLGFDAFVDVRVHGAVGDGAADDTTEIQAALDALEAAGGGMLFFPEGQYNISSQVDVPSNVVLMGTGFASRIHMTVADTQMFEVSAESNVGFAQLRLTGQGGYTTAGLGAIRLGLGSAGNGATDCWVRDCWIIGVSNNGITIGSKSIRCRIVNVLIDGAGEENIYLLGEDCSVVGCTSKSAGEAGIKISSAKRPTVVGNTFADSTIQGINVTGDTVGGVVAGNTVLRSGQSGIHLDGNADGVACVGNYVEASSQTADQNRDNIQVSSAAATKIFIDGNVCRKGSLTNGPRDGLRITSGTDVIVGDNDLRDGGKAGQYTDAGTNTQGTHLKARVAPASGSTTLTAATDTDISGCSITVTPLLTQVVTVYAVVDLTRVTADTLSIHLDVNGSNESGQIIMNDSARQPVFGVWVLTLTGGTAYTIKLQGVLQAGTGEWTANSTGTKLVLAPGGLA